MKNRERLFFGIPNLSAWTFTGINLLNILKLKNDYIYGRALQFLLYNLFGNIWKPSNETLYTILNKYEEEGYVKSYWEQKSNQYTRFIRPYIITKEGENYLNYKKKTLHSDLIYMDKIIKRSLDIVWDTDTFIINDEKKIRMSSSFFTILNVLNLLYKSENWLYGNQIKELLNEQYYEYWKPSDGVLYPKLYNLETKGIVQSRWRLEDNCKNTKKRTIREYQLTEIGKKYFLDLIYASNTKNKLLELNNLTNNSIKLLYGDNYINLNRIKTFLNYN